MKDFDLMMVHIKETVAQVQAECRDAQQTGIAAWASGGTGVRGGHSEGYKGKGLKLHMCTVEGRLELKQQRLEAKRRGEMVNEQDYNATQWAGRGAHNPLAAASESAYELSAAVWELPTLERMHAFMRGATREALGPAADAAV